MIEPMLELPKPVPALTKVAPAVPQGAVGEPPGFGVPPMQYGESAGSGVAAVGDRLMNAAEFTQKFPGVARDVVLPEVAIGIADWQLPDALHLLGSARAALEFVLPAP